MSVRPDFTPQAAKRWAELGGRMQTLLLNNVWCVACSKTTTIAHVTGRVERGNIVLEGRCMRCDGPVARLVEGA